MDDGLDYKPTASEIWPPPPTLPPPQPMPSQSLFVRGGILVPILVSIGWGLIEFGVEYLRQWMMHPAHVIHWDGVRFSGITLFALTLPANIWLRSKVLKQRHKEAAVLALEAKAAEQSATE